MAGRRLFPALRSRSRPLGAGQASLVRGPAGSSCPIICTERMVEMSPGRLKTIPSVGVV